MHATTALVYCLMFLGLNWGLTQDTYTQFCGYFSGTDSEIESWEQQNLWFYKSFLIDYRSLDLSEDSFVIPELNPTTLHCTGLEYVKRMNGWPNKCWNVYQNKIKTKGKYEFNTNWMLWITAQVLNGWAIGLAYSELPLNWTRIQSIDNEWDSMVSNVCVEQYFNNKANGGLKRDH